MIIARRAAQDALFISLLTLLGVVITISLLARSAKAQEINPDPSTYTYGSTSEFSPYASLSTGTTSGSLAETGADQLVGYGLAVVLVSGALVCLYASRKYSVKVAQNA